MSLANWFWILFVIGVLFGFGYPVIPVERRSFAVGFGSLLLVLLIGLLGWQVFGSVAK